jgi:hypothetical protein
MKGCITTILKNGSKGLKMIPTTIEMLRKFEAFVILSRIPFVLAYDARREVYISPKTERKFQEWKAERYNKQVDI